MQRTFLLIFGIVLTVSVYSQELPKKLHYVEQILPYPIYPYLEKTVDASRRFQNLFYETLIDDNKQNNGYESRHINLESCQLNGKQFIAEYIKGWYWHDNMRLVTLDDLKYSIKVANDFGVFNPIIINEIKTEDNNLILELGANYPSSIKSDILDKMRHVLIVPVGSKNDLSSFSKSPSGTGAFRWDETEGRKIKLYSIDGDMSPLGQPNIDDVIIEEIPLTISHWTNMQNFGEINLLIESTRFSKTAVKDLPDYKLKPYASDKVSFLLFNYNNDLFDDYDFRLAIDLSIRKERLVNETLQGEGDKMSGPFSNKSPYYDPTVIDNGHDRVKAEALLNNYLKKDGDYFERNGKPISLKLIYDKNQRNEEGNVLDQIESELQNLGIKVTKKALITPNYLVALKKGKFDIAYYKHPYDRRSFADLLFASKALLKEKGLSNSNFGNYEDKKVDVLVEQWHDAEDRISKNKIGKQFHKTLKDDVASIFLFSQTSYAIHHKSIQPIIVPYYFFGRPHEWKISEE